MLSVEYQEQSIKYQIHSGRFQMSSVNYQVSSAKCQVIKRLWQISNDSVREQMPGVMWQAADVKIQLSVQICKSQMSSVKL